jgi:hypothetical protein
MSCFNLVLFLLLTVHQVTVISSTPIMTSSRTVTNATPKRNISTTTELVDPQRIQPTSRNTTILSPATTQKNVTRYRQGIQTTTRSLSGMQTSRQVTTLRPSTTIKINSASNVQSHRLDTRQQNSNRQNNITSITSGGDADQLYFPDAMPTMGTITTIRPTSTITPASSNVTGLGEELGNRIVISAPEMTTTCPEGMILTKKGQCKRTLSGK